MNIFFLQLSETLNIDLQLVKNAVSVFCRLGFAKKRVTGLENLALHSTWASYMVVTELVLYFLHIYSLFGMKFFLVRIIYHLSCFVWFLELDWKILRQLR